MHVNLGGYHISDIEFTAAFDVVKGKVGEDLADAMWAHPNDTIKFADVPKTGVKVSRGMTHDGIGKYLSEVVEKAPGKTDDIVGILKETKTDVVVNYLPVGSEMATKWYAEQILEAGCAMVNCMPVFIAREDYWQKRFEDAGVPIIGDDIKSQVGATITHRVLTSLFRERGIHLDKTMQLNVGGNSDFLNMLERERLESKKISKTNAVTSMLDYDLGPGNVHVGPSDYVPWLTDRKWAYIRMEGSAFGDVPLNMELKLEVWDSPNSAGIVIDAVRLAKLALNNGIAGSLVGPSSYLMKSPPKQIVDDEAYELTEAFIEQNKRTARRGEGAREADRFVTDCHQRSRGPASAGPRRPRSRDGEARTTLGRGMALRVALVTPFAWSQPHDVNEHVDGLARALRRRGHSATVLAPSNRARDLADGRRVLLAGSDAELIALGPAVPISRSSRIGVPVGVRANLAMALAQGRYDVVHGFEPALPSLSYLALRDSGALTAATFFSPERLSYPPGRAQRERLLARVDALLATGEEIAEAAALRFPGHYEVVPHGVDLELFRPAAKRRLVVLEWRQAERPLLRALVRELAEQPDWELVLLRTRPLGARPPQSRRLRGRVHVRTALDGPARAEVLREAAVFVPAARGPAADRGGGARGRRRGRRPARTCAPAGARDRRGGPADRGRGLPQPPRRTRGPRPRAARASRRSPTASRRCTSGSRAAGAARRGARSGPRSASGSSPTCTCTPPGRTTARPRSTSCSTTPRRRVSARSPSPTTTCSAARSRRWSGPAAAGSSSSPARR